MSNSTLCKGDNMFTLLILWNTMMIPPEHIPEINAAINTITAHKEKYVVAQKKTGIDWKILGAIHYMEANCNFDRQLFNGEYWTEVTKKTPEGVGPWDSWLESTVSFVKTSALGPKDNLHETLLKLEAHNGLGYMYLGMNSPYLWNYSNHQERGKFTADGVFDPTLKSKQVGAAVILKLLKYNIPTQLELPL